MSQAPTMRGTEKLGVFGQKKLTHAQMRLLKRLRDAPGSALSIETVDEYRYPIFRGRFHAAACPTCRHTVTTRADWRVIFALAEAGCIKERLRGTDYYLSADITPAGRAALLSAKGTEP